VRRLQPHAKHVLPHPGGNPGANRWFLWSIHLWEIDLRFAPGLPAGTPRNAGASPARSSPPPPGSSPPSARAQAPGSSSSSLSDGTGPRRSLGLNLSDMSLKYEPASGGAPRSLQKPPASTPTPMAPMAVTRLRVQPATILQRASRHPPRCGTRYPCRASPPRSRSRLEPLTGKIGLRMCGPPRDGRARRAGMTTGRARRLRRLMGTYPPRRRLRLKPETLNPTLYTINPAPYTLHPSPYTLHHKPYTLHPTPYTLHRTPCTIHHKPYTRHPKPYTLNHTPTTPNPKLQALNLTPKP